MFTPANSPAAMSAADFERFAPRATVVDLERGVDLITPLQVITHCWFPLSGLLSVIAIDEDGGEAEVGLVGVDGIVDLATALGDDCGVSRLLVQMTGTAVRIDAPSLQAAMLDSPALSRLLLAYARAFSVQMAFSALAYARYPIPRRLARWLLMASDRIGQNEIELTHDALSIMLGVRRAGVTVALRTLSTNGLIAMRRGRIEIRDRPGLRTFAGCGYGSPESEYERLLAR